MKEIIYKDLSNGEVLECRDLCNELLSYQADQSYMNKEVLLSMNYENRLEDSFNSTSIKYLLVAYDNNTPIGYVYCTATLVNEEDVSHRPLWAKEFKGKGEGMFPRDMKVPVMVACLNNLYIKKEYRGCGIGDKLMDGAMRWIKTSKSDVAYVYISNGNNVEEYYKKYGFKYSHEVYGGFIKAYNLNLNVTKK